LVVEFMRFHASLSPQMLIPGGMQVERLHTATTNERKENENYSPYGGERLHRSSDVSEEILVFSPTHLAESLSLLLEGISR